MSLHWKKNSGDSSSSGQPSAPPPLGMGLSHSKPTNPCQASSSKPSPKTLFQDNPSIHDSSDSESLEVNSTTGNATPSTNLPHDDNAEIRHDAMPLSPALSHGNTPPVSPSPLTDWKISQTPDSLKLYDEFAKERYFSDFCSRKLNRGRGVLFSSIPESPVVTWIMALNWDRVMSVNKVCYPHLVKLFYTNLSLENDDNDNPRLKTFVLGKEIVLSTAYINALFDLPDEGAKFFSLGDWNTPEYTLTDLRNLFWEGRAYSFSRGKALNNLSIHYFFLHKLICCTLLSGPTTGSGHTTDINALNMFLTFMAVHGRPVNLGYVLLKNIAYSAFQTRKNLPYGMLLTLIFKREDIFLPPSWMEPLKDRRVIDLLSLRKMRIQYSETDGWYRGVRKDTKDDPVEVSSSLDSPPRKRTCSSTSAIPPPHLDAVAFHASLASLHAKIDTQSTTILALANQVKKLRKKLRKRFPS
ncbi:hypothetical protein CDL12_20538 [Handroanthus impetiginosus]|uniref:Putative plant transposon protein domain-containing protein n=1 Tax=Handroanthus impetiginosus TaxID=429701 RepID=A0A2G9GNW6_9LAMI|nr:hypothetical protein CDL12_20538 [Handroanthus impetiginosus]